MKSDVLVEPAISEATLERIEREFLRNDAAIWPSDRELQVPAALDPGRPPSDLAGRRPTMIRTRTRCCD
jgi:hypothetical protein